MRDPALVSQPARRNALLAMLVALSLVFSLGFACAAPLAAFAGAAALMPSHRDALTLAGAAWLVNQVIGFAALGYPWTLDCAVWGVVLGAVTFGATLVARAALARFAVRGTVLRHAAALVAAFATYEGALFAASLVLGGTEDYAPSNVAWIFALNAVAGLALLAADQLGALVGLGAAPLVLPKAAE